MFVSLVSHYCTVPVHDNGTETLPHLKLTKESYNIIEQVGHWKLGVSDMKGFVCMLNIPAIELNVVLTFYLLEGSILMQSGKFDIL